MGKEKSSGEYYHDKGEQDYSKGRYERPTGPGDLFSKPSDKFVSDAKAYDKGYDNAKNQPGKIDTGCLIALLPLLLWPVYHTIFGETKEKRL